ncbi:MAG TPA: penicillin-binding protein 2 [Gaiellaceae bacterium]|nr:penicillin-binding protein 2 [Gaiellaceae bacterium]
MRPGALVNRRIRLLLAALALAFGGILLRAVWIQGVRASSLSRLASSQHRETIALPASRGTIYDRTGSPLAIGEQATTVYADPKQIANPHAAALAAEKALGVDASKLEPRLADRRLGFVYVERKADPLAAAALGKRGIAGFGFYPEERRTYPQGRIAAQVLGFAGVDNRGLGGLELQLDHTLTGKAGSETIVKDPLGRAIDVVREIAPREGHDVRLTLDHTIQANAEEVLRQTVATSRAKSATAIVLDPRTGAVLAMAVEPGFDANRYSEVPAALQANRAVVDTYEPGSTFKLVTVAGALSDGLVSPRTLFTLAPSIQVADRVIHDAEPRGTETMSVAQILSRSSNVGAITLAEMLKRDRLLSWIKRFGFGRPTGLDYPGESGGILPSYWSGSTIGNVPIGQGIAVTPMQMASAYAAIANRGVSVRPHLVARARAVRRRVVTRTVAAQLSTMLRGVVTSGTGVSAAIPGYRVAGKTGTAQKPDGHGGYSNRYVASFVGFVPASHPRLVVLVMVDEPKTAIWGGAIAAPAFQQIARFDLQYLEVPPDAPQGHAGSSGY